MSVVVALAAACVSISAAHITAGDFEKAIPAFTAIDSSAVIAWSPAPGITRVFHPGEVRQLMAHFGSTAAPPQEDICFERPVALLSEAMVLQAMRVTLGNDSKVEILETSRFPVPEGEIVFPREALEASPIALWRGFVRYDGDKRFPVWARVKVHVALTRVIAAEALEEGKPIQRSQVKLETIEGSWSNRAVSSSFEQVEGYVPRHTIAAHTPIWTDSIDLPKEVVRGDRVTVTVHSGLALLTFAVDAVTSGRHGDFISLKNPESGKMFRARVEGPKTVSLQIEPVKP